MKTLTLKQPWATLIADGFKVIEIRTWGTEYRGPLAIHAGKGEDINGLLAALAVLKPEERGAFERRVVADKGRIIAESRLVAVEPYVRFDDFARDGSKHLNHEDNYEQGLFGWFLENVMRLVEPVNVRGQLGLWEAEVGGKRKS